MFITFFIMLFVCFDIVIAKVEKTISKKGLLDANHPCNPGIIKVKFFIS